MGSNQDEAALRVGRWDYESLASLREALKSESMELRAHIWDMRMQSKREIVELKSEIEAIKNAMQRVCDNIGL